MTPFVISIIRSAVAILLVFGVVVFLLSQAQKNRSQKIAVLPKVDQDAVYIHHGASLIDDGYNYYPDWSTFMLREFDDSIQPHLNRYFAIAESAAQHPRSQWTAVIEEQLAKE